MEYKMLCVDVDGTLLSPDSTIAPEVKQAIARITFEQYIPVILVSARPPQAMEFLQEELDIMRPMICMGGGLIVQEDEVLHSIALPFKAARHVLSIADDFDVESCIYSGWKWYVGELTLMAKMEGKVTHSMPEAVDLNKLLEEMEAGDIALHKMMCMGEQDNVTALEQALNKDNPSGLDIRLSLPEYLEIAPAGVDKAAAIEKVSGLYGYDMSQVVAVGDHMNDIPMLQAVGMGVAMGNAPDEVKQAARDVTLSHSEGGVAAAINKYF